MINSLFGDSEDNIAHTSNKYSMQRNHIFSWVHPTILLLCGLCALVPYMLTESLLVRGLQVFVFFIVAIQIKHVRIAYFLFLVLTITFFYLLVPQGKVIFQYGPIRVTEEALTNGFFRGITLVGYVFLSLWCISPMLRLPTMYGALLSKSLQYFELFIEISSHIKYREIFRVQKNYYRDRKKLVQFSKYITEITDILIVRVISNLDDSVAKSKEEEKTSIDTKKRTADKKYIVWGIIALCALMTVAFLGLLI